jgi:hypothetical protein
MMMHGIHGLFDEKPSGNIGEKKKRSPEDEPLKSERL